MQQQVIVLVFSWLINMPFVYANSDYFLGQLDAVYYLTYYQIMCVSMQIDRQLASGEYFIQEKERRLKAQQERKVC